MNVCLEFLQHQINTRAELFDIILEIGVLGGQHVKKYKNI